MILNSPWGDDSLPVFRTGSSPVHRTRLQVKHLKRLVTAGLLLGTVALFCPGTAFAADDLTDQSVEAVVQDESGSTTEAEPDPLAAQVNEAISISSRRYLTAGLHTPWQIMHGLLALRQDFQIKKEGEKVSALEWMADGATFRGQPLFQVTQYGGRAHPYTEPYIFQGHAHQFLAIFALADVPLDYEFKVGQSTITVADMVKNAQMDLDGSEETTFSLWALSHYLEPDAKWTNKWGYQWSIEDLVRAELQESVSHSACGGTHILFALTYARNRYLKTKRPLQGVWLQADRLIKQHVEIAKAYQNQDGSFSASYFDGPHYSAEFMTRLETTGHTLEWLSLALNDEQMQEEWVRRGAAAVARDLVAHRHNSIDCGPLYHSLDGLVIYRSRVFPSSDPLERTATTKETGQDKPNGASGRDQTALRTSTDGLGS